MDFKVTDAIISAASKKFSRILIEAFFAAQKEKTPRCPQCDGVLDVKDVDCCPDFLKKHKND